jgi:hypothetical protein
MGDKMGTLKRVERRSCGCCLFLALAFLLLVAGLTFLIVKAARAESLPPAYDVILVSDQSTSMWDCDGIGTDPELLRVDATRLFINTLGADSSARYRLALLHFGGEVEQAAPLTDLADAAARAALLAAASQPQPMRWTDHLLALRAAAQLLVETGEPGSRRLIVLLTDGEPAPNPTIHGRPYAATEYLRELQGLAGELAQADTALAVVLLSDTRTSCGRRVATEWAGPWTALAETTPGGELYAASQAADLLPIYHAIVRQMLGVAASAAPATTTVLTPAMPFVLDVPVTEPLASLILTIWRRDPMTTVEVRAPAGDAVMPGQADVTVMGRAPAGREEVWRINRPAQGAWQVILTGQGWVSVWQDRLPLPTPTPSPTPTSSVTPTASATRSWTATALPLPTHTQTVTPAVTSAVAATGMPPPVKPTGAQDTAPRGLAWPLIAGGGATLGLAAVGLAASRRHGPCLSGQLIPLAAPAAAPLLAPLDLGSERRRRVIVGRGGQGVWALPGWAGAVRLTAVSRRTVSISPLAGEATVDGLPLRQPTDLADGAVIGCGEYRIRYENLLA